MLSGFSLEQGDTLRLDGGDTYYYTAPWDGEIYTRGVDPWDLTITWYDGNDNQISTGADNQDVVVTQDMIDTGFYVTAVYESSLTFYHDDGLTQLADDPDFGDINVGVGDSAAPVMFAADSGDNTDANDTDTGGGESGDDSDSGGFSVPAETFGFTNFVQSSIPGVSSAGSIDVYLPAGLRGLSGVYIQLDSVDITDFTLASGYSGAGIPTSIMGLYSSLVI